MTIHKLLCSILIVASCSEVPNHVISDSIPDTIVEIAEEPKPEFTVSDIGSIEFKAFDTSIAITVFEQTREPDSCQVGLLNNFKKEQFVLKPIIIDSVFRYYRKVYPFYKEGAALAGAYSEFELHSWLPAPSNAHDLVPYYKPSRLYLPVSDSCTISEYGIEFDCTWDIEHSLGVKIRDGKVIMVGIDEVAWCR